MRTFYEVKEALKRAVKVTTDKFIAEDLGINYDTFRNRVTRNSIPFKEVLDFCVDKNINPIEILYKEVKNGN